MINQAKRCLLAGSLLCWAAAAVASAAGGGAAPPDRLSAQHQARVVEILAPYKKSPTLTNEQAATILRALRAAQVPSGPALDRVLTENGFSRKRLQALAPQAAASAPASAPARVPRPQ